MAYLLGYWLAARLTSTDGLADMRRATKMYKTCPFHGIDEAERKELAQVEPENWACHTEQGYYSSCDIQCRGHWEAQRKYPANSSGDRT